MHLSLKSVKSIAAALFGCALLALPVAAHATQTVESLYLNGTSPVTGHTYSSLCTGLAWNPNPTTDIVCIESIAQAVSDASSYLASGDLVNIYFPTGTVDISWETKYNSTGGHGTNYSANGYIDVTGVRPAFAGGYQGELRVAGSGSGSTLITDNSLTTIYGKNLADVKFVSFTFTRSVATTSQGVVTSTGLNTAGQITFNVPNSSFLTPLQLYQNAIYDHGGTEANTEYIRAYTNSATAPVIVNVADNTQIAWGARTTTCPQTLDSFGYCAPHLNGDGTWTIYFDNGSAGTKAPSDAYTGNFVGMKMEGPAQAYYFYDNSYPTGDSVGFDHVTWQDMSRGVWDNITNAFVTNSSIVPRAALGGQAFCLSVPTGGPQFSQPGDAGLNLSVLVNNFTASNTGDDTIAIFNDSNTVIGSGSSIVNSTITSSFARDVNLFNSCYVKVPVPYDPGSPSNANTITGCFSAGTSSGSGPGDNFPTYYGGCVTDTTPSNTTTPKWGTPCTVPPWNPAYPSALVWNTPPL